MKETVSKHPTSQICKPLENIMNRQHHTIMKLMQKTVVFFCLMLLSSLTFAQTAGSGILFTIESLAKKEAENSKKVGELNRKHMDSYVSEDTKSIRLQNELAELERKKEENAIEVKRKIESKLNEIETSSAWINRRKSAQRGWKEYSPGTCSAGGPPPICPAEHWYRVAVTEAMREYDALVQKELDKIKNNENKYNKELENKRREIFDFQDGDNEFSQLRDKLNKEMNEIVAENRDIRQRISELSKIYVSQIEAEIKSMQNNDIKGVMIEIAQKHFTILKIGVLEAKLIELEQEEKQELSDLNDKIRKHNDQKIAYKNKLVIQKQNEINSYQVKTNTEVNSHNKELAKLQKEEKDIEKLLGRKDELTNEQLAKLITQQNEIKDLIKSTENKVNNANSNFKEFKVRTETEIATLKNDIWNLQVNLTTVIREAEDNLKQAYATKRGILADAILGRKTKLASIKAAISIKRDEFRNKAKDYQRLVEPERIRLIQACKESGASCWGSDVVSKIWENANKLISCSNDMENNSVLYTGCEEAFSYYTSVYNSYMNGISDEEMGKLMRLNPSYEYQKLLNKLK